MGMKLITILGEGIDNDASLVDALTKPGLQKRARRMGVEETTANTPPYAGTALL